MPTQRLSILGVGLLGGSIGLAVKERLSDWEITGYGQSSQRLQMAQNIGAIDRIAPSFWKAVDSADLVILATPVGTFGDILREIAETMKPNSIVTDVGSTKQSVVELAQEVLPANIKFVGSHPIAGSEKKGIQHARADLMEGALCITTPTPQTDPKALEKVESFWATLGMRIKRLGPAEHDRLLGDVSHLPHALAAALVMIQSDAGLAVAGKGFADATRIAAGDAGMWRDILIDNRNVILDGLKRLNVQINELQAALLRNDGAAVEKFLAAAAAKREAFQPGNGA